MENKVLSTLANTQPRTTGQSQKSRQSGKELFARALNEATVAICDTSLDTTASFRAAPEKLSSQNGAERTSSFRSRSYSDTDENTSTTEAKSTRREDDWNYGTKEEAGKSEDDVSLEAGTAAVQCQVQQQDSVAQKTQSQEGETESASAGTVQVVGSGEQAVSQTANQNAMQSSSTANSANTANATVAVDPTALAATASKTVAAEAQVSAEALNVQAAEAQVSAEALNALAEQKVSAEALPVDGSGESAEPVAGDLSSNVAKSAMAKANSAANAATVTDPAGSTNASAVQNAGNGALAASVETGKATANTSAVSAAAATAQTASSTGNKAGDTGDGKLTAAQVSGESPPAVTLVQAAETKAVGSAGNLSELARSTEARSTDLAQQISQGVETMTRSGQTTMRLNLHPEELGRIDLRLTVNAQGTWVSVTADQKETSQLLQQHLNDLRQSLTQAGVQLGGLNVGQETSQGYQETLSQAKLYKTGRSSSQVSAAISDSSESPRSRSLGSDATLDYLV